MGRAAPQRGGRVSWPSLENLSHDGWYDSARSRRGTFLNRSISGPSAEYSDTVGVNHS